MNDFDASMSDMNPEQSQATQLIHAVLENSPGPSEGRTRNKVAPSNKDISIDLLPSSKHSGTSNVQQYDFYGLVATQLETQPNDEANSLDSGLIPNEGSQKENFGVSGGKPGRDTRWGMPSPDSRPTSPHRLTVKDNVTMPERSGTPGRVAKPKPPTVAFQSPVKSLMPPKLGHQPVPVKEKMQPQPSGQRNNRSHSPSLSEDSFAQGDSQFAEEHFLVMSKKFTTPLAHLAHTDEDEGDLSRRTEISYPSYPSRTVVHENDDPPPVILVPSTPSDSASSEHSRDEISTDKANRLAREEDSFERAQGAGRTILDSDSSKGSQHSQGFDGQEEVAEVQVLYSGLRDSKNTSQSQSLVLDTRYLGTQQATQAATQEEAFLPATPSLIPQTNTSTTHTHTGPRSLLSTMDPSKRNRYQHLIQLTPVSQKSSSPQQSSSLEGSHPAPILPISQPIRAPLSPHKPSRKKQIYRQPPPPTADTIDVVPDSEPSREHAQISVADDHSLEVQKQGFEPPRKRRLVKKWSSDSEVTEDSDVVLPSKITLREEEEESPGNDQVEIGSGGVKVGRREEVDNNEDDDEPLMTRLYKGKGVVSVGSSKMRGKPPHAVYIPESKSKVRKFRSPGPVEKPTRLQKGRSALRNIDTVPADISHQSTIPSSVPDQDHPRSVRSRKPSSNAVAAVKGKGKQPQQKSSSRATSVARSTRSRRSGTVETEINDDIEMEDCSDVERSTEIAIDEDVSEEEDEEEDYMEPEAPRLKRKRGRPPKSKSLNQVMVTPRTRLNKRLRSTGSTMSRADATRVFAMWQRNGLWYSGTVWEHNGDNNYCVKFDDGLEKIVNTDDMRTHNLRTGDLVRFNSKTKDYKVVKVDHRADKVLVDFGGETEEMEIKFISISTKEIKSAWQDRIVDARTVVPSMRYVDTKVNPIPSPSRSAGSFLSINKAKGPRHSHKFLQRVGLIVSLSGNNLTDKTKDGKTRSDILTAVRDSGGVVIDDLFKYLKMEISYSTNTWVLERSDAHWGGQPKELQRLFLLADDCNLKPKYLIALALGIPCLSVNWLFTCLDAGRELDWRPHLLPQGRPTINDVVPSQQVDLSWGDRPEHLIDIMSNPVASRLLEGQSVLCLGLDMTTRGKDEATSYIVRIILAMGATRVETSRDATNAVNPLSHYDLLILRDKELYSGEFVQIHTVDWNWVKDSLIMSRRLAFPSWSAQEDSQCSQSL